MSRRKVHFSVPIHQIEYLENTESEDSDDHPYSSLYWAHVAADRDRFKKRIEQLSSILSNIFVTEFRQQVYKERFENFIAPSPPPPSNTVIEDNLEEEQEIKDIIVQKANQEEEEGEEITEDLDLKLGEINQEKVIEIIEEGQDKEENTSIETVTNTTTSTTDSSLSSLQSASPSPIKQKPSVTLSDSKNILN